MSHYFYLDYDTFFHRFDPRTKIFLLIGGLVLLAIWNGSHLILLYSFLAVTLFILILSKSLSNLNRVKALLFASAFVSIFSWVLAGGGKTYIWGPITVEALNNAQQGFLRMACGVLISIWFLSTTRNEDILVGLQHLRVPYRLGFTFGIILRLAPTLISVTETILQAQQSRGVDLTRGGLIKRLKKYFPLVVPAFAGAIRSTNQFSMAIEARGFGAKPQRTSITSLKMTSQDYSAIILMAFILVVGVLVA